jgi:hypothetical protein
VPRARLTDGGAQVNAGEAAAAAPDRGSGGGGRDLGTKLDSFRTETRG